MRKDSPNLYEILKNATGGTIAPPEVLPRTSIVVAESPAKPGSGPRATVPSKPPETPSAVQAGLGERVIRLTYNTAIFAGLVVLGAIFLAFALGQRVGKSKGRAEVTATSETATQNAVADTISAPAGKSWSVKLMEWPANDSRESLIGMQNAAGFANALKQAGFTPAWDVVVARGAKKFRVLYCGQFKDRAEGRDKLAALKKFKYQGKFHFAQADFEEIEP